MSDLRHKPLLQPLPCGCSLMDGRCDTHGQMMREIHEAWFRGGAQAHRPDYDDRSVAMVIWDLSDGYGTPGYVPEGYDWSGIRDSSIEAIEAMYAAIHA